MSLAKTLEMDHLKQPAPSIDELKGQVEGAVKAEKEDPRDQERWSFHFSWTDRRGKLWAGDFTNEVLTIGESALVGALQARLNGGQPHGAIEPLTNGLNRAIAHMTYSLKECPNWAKDLTKLRDPSVIWQLWEKVSSHEARFFRLEDTEGESESSDGVGQG